MKEIISTLQYTDDGNLKDAYKAIEKKVKTGTIRNNLVTEIAEMLIPVTGSKDIDFAMILIKEEICRRFMKDFYVNFTISECWKLSEMFEELARDTDTFDSDVQESEESDDPCCFMGADEQFIREEELNELNKEICDYITDI